MPEPVEPPDPLTWVERHGDLLFRFAVARVRDRTVAEDIVHDTLLAAIESRDSLKSVGHERGWLLAILRHKLMDHFRRRARDQGTWDELAELEEMPGDFDDKGCWSTSPLEWATPERALEQEEFWAAFGRCIDALPTKLKVPFALRELDGVESEDVAQTLGTTRNNLWVMLSRARHRIRDCLDRHWFNT